MQEGKFFSIIPGSLDRSEIKLTEIINFFLAYRILVPQPGFEPTLLAKKAQSPNHWTTREFPKLAEINRRKAYKLFLSFMYASEWRPKEVARVGSFQTEKQKNL